MIFLNWANFQTYNDASTKAFEILCNQLFENWCHEEYSSSIESFSVINGSGGDGGVESLTVLKNGDFIGLQAKWFHSSISTGQITQIRNSIKTAMKTRPQIIRYIVCVPRDLSSLTGKGKQTEENRWESLVSDMKSEFPSLLVELWTESRLVLELQKDSSVGIYKFWFQNSEISEENVRFSFEKSKKSWLSTKYTPDLNTYGEIDESISKFLGNVDERRVVKQTLKKLYNLCDDYFEASNDLITLCAPNDIQLASNLKKLNDQLSVIKTDTKKMLTWFENERTFDISIDEDHFLTDIDLVIENLKSSKEKQQHYFHFREVSKVLEKINRIDLFDAIKSFKFGIETTPLLFLGEPGTGKTHGVSAQTQKILDNGVHIPIIIQARNFPREYSWKDIIASSIGLSSNWSEDEIWQALSSLANRKRFNTIDTETGILPKVIIIVDGLDESTIQDKWIQHIQETNAITSIYPRLRFCFTSRPYVIKKETDFAKIIRIGTGGDTPTHKLFQMYINYYNINVDNATWIKYALTTPLSLKLFCEINQGKTINLHDQTDISITALLKQKISILETEFSTQFNGFQVDNQFILKSIRLISLLFLNEPSIEKSMLIKSITEELCFDNHKAEILVKYLTDYGILRSSGKQNSGLLPDTYYYYPGIQGYFDYVSALMLLEEHNHPQEIDFNIHNNLPNNSLYALAIISMQNFNYLIISNKTIKQVVDLQFREELLFISLRYVDPKDYEQYEKKLFKMMSSSAEYLISITNNLILPLARNNEHPLGTILLDKFLFSFTSPAQRDILWSIPCMLKGNFNDKWFYTNELALDKEEFVLSDFDTACGCPTVHAWALSSTNNIKRKKIRSSLMKWARVSPYEFYKLFLKFAFINDQQIRSDIFSILMSLLFEDENLELIKEASEWLIENVLSPEKIKENNDISIRYYSYSIVQKSISMGLLKSEHTNLYLPPYQPVDNFIPLNKNALAGTRMGGYSSISYDLARYVLIDHFDSNFSNHDRRVKNQHEKLLENIVKDQPSYEGISFDQFIISAAYSFLLECGWNEDDFNSYDREKKKPLGADSAIHFSYHPQTHGSKSKTMTICEKYIWQARNFISGFLADRLFYCDDEIIKVSDYSLLDDFTIPMQELNQIDPDNISESQPWHIPEQDAVLSKKRYKSKEDVIKNVSDSQTVDWFKWLFVDNKKKEYRIKSNSLAALSSYSSFFSPSGVKTSLSINSALIDSNDLSKFLSMIDNDSQLCKSISNPSEWSGGIDSSTYITPKEICWFPWKKRYDSMFFEYFPQITLTSAVDKCCYSFSDYGEVFYELPSAPMRKLLQISNSDGYSFYDNNKNIQAEYTIAGEKWATYQDYLLVDKDKVLSETEKNGKTIIWIMREFRTEDPKTTEKYDEFFAEKDLCHIGYFEKNKFITKLIFSNSNSRSSTH